MRWVLVRKMVLHILKMIYSVPGVNALVYNLAKVTDINSHPHIVVIARDDAKFVFMVCAWTQGGLLGFFQTQFASFHDCSTRLRQQSIHPKGCTTLFRCVKSERVRVELDLFHNDICAIDNEVSFVIVDEDVVGHLALPNAGFIVCKSAQYCTTHSSCVLIYFHDHRKGDIAF